MARLEVQESSPIPVIRYIFTRRAGEEVAENITNNEQEFPGQKAAHRAEFFQGAQQFIHHVSRGGFPGASLHSQQLPELLTLVFQTQSSVS